ncbi:MAG TPA: iron-containing alcohol dehydrogenase [Desulfobacterales bacterium]
MSTGKIGKQIRTLGAQKPYACTDKGIIDSGIPDQVVEVIRRDCEVEPVVYDKTQPNPTDTNVHKGLDLCKQNGCDLPHDVCNVILMRHVQRFDMVSKWNISSTLPSQWERSWMDPPCALWPRRPWKRFGPRDAKNFLWQHQIDFRIVYGDLPIREECNEVMRRLCSLNPSVLFPTITVNWEVIAGFKEEKLRRALSLWLKEGGMMR